MKHVCYNKLDALKQVVTGSKHGFYALWNELRRKMKMKKLLLLLMTGSLAFMAACGQPAAKEDQSAQNGQMAITFDYVSQDGYASNQFAIWPKTATARL